MSWLYSRALVEAYSEANSLVGEPSVPLSGTPTPQAFLSPDRMTAFSRLSRFGMTFKPLTESLGANVLTWFLAAFPVRTSHALERAQESKESGLECGSTWRESSVKYCRASSSWKTHRFLWEEVLPESSVTLPQWGMMQDGVLWERITPDFRTSEKESGYWPTPLKSDGYLSSYPHSSFDRDHSIASLPEFVSRSFKMRITPETSERLMNWPDGWTDLSASATAKFRLWCRSHGISYDNK